VKFSLPGTHVGDIEEFPVIKTGNIFTLWATFPAACFLIEENPITISSFWVHPRYDDCNLFLKSIWFLKSRMLYDRITLDAIPDLTKIAIKNLSRFRKSWYNTETKLYEPVSEYFGEDGERYLKKPWMLTVENTGDFSEWPKFGRYAGEVNHRKDLRCLYDIFEDFEWHIR
jgi:hypothetical protein